MNTLTFPAPTPLHAVLDGLNSPPHFQPKKIPRLLLVDDEPRLLSSMVELLYDFGYHLVTATCGTEAIEHLSKLEFDLVLLDLRMPDMGGHAVMDFINNQGLSANVIILSGDAGIDSAIDALKRGAVGYLRKPYPHTELLSTVTNVLQKRQLETENRLISSQLEHSEKLYRYLVDSSPDIIYTINAEGRFTFINDRAQQLLGFNREELLGQHYSKVVHEDDMERAHYVFNERRIGERATRNVELRLKCINPDDAERTFATTVMTISFNSMGLYSEDQLDRKREYFGTYGVARDVTERKRTEELISYQAYHDILTDLPNRILFCDRLNLALIQAQRNKSELAVMFVDLDRFKLVNDSFGHLMGDICLQQVAARLKQNLRRGDTLARQGGDEFIMLVPDLRERQDAAAIADKFLESLSTPLSLDGIDMHVSASIGIAIYPDDGETAEELIRHADIAMYQVKTLGKNDFRFYDNSMLDASNQKILLELGLRKALELHELEMYYQPQVDIVSGRIVGAEALMRWNSPDRGVLLASDFLPFAEESGLIIPISDWMIQAVCRDLHDANAAGGESIKMSVNLSPGYLDRGEFVNRLKDALSSYAIPPSQMEVEITENICIRNPQYAIEQLNKLCELGVSVAIDDFGTGYSSLAYLHRFPIQTLKIDQSFIKEIQQESGHFPVVLAVISIARGLGLNLVAEGVETECQAHYLEQAGCTIMQGYLFHKPMMRDQFIQQLTDQAKASD